MTSTGTWHRMAVGLACVGVTLAVPAGAMALSTHKAKDTTPNSSGQLVATAQCGKGEHVVSGGFKGETGRAAVASHALGGDGWQVEYPGGTSPTSLTVYAYCSSKGGISAHHKQAQGVAPPPNTTVAARCAPGQTLVSGGFEFSSNPLSDQNGSTTYKNYGVSSRTWKLTGAFENVPATLTAFAYCERGVVVKVRSHSATVPANGHGSATASCHKGESLLAGGYSTTPKPDWENTNGPDLFFSASYRSGVRSWTVRAHNYSNVGGKAVVFAYCKA